ncbi:unnamed protein product [Urochloa decumbens]|uniref:Alpha/beta hydrolase fold-3 domain-containing protein n=1 Tax=Urochloa decumbens TaxID=240449 RepID=A0ABC9AFQ5_9POAL
MSGGTAPRVVEDYRGVIQILSDGTILRSDPAILRPPESFPDVPGVEWDDVVYDAAHGLKLRVYRPAPPPAAGDDGDAKKKKKKLPVLVYFHSGGFCLGSFAQPHFHAGCLRLASELPAVVLSADYRLGPEHRLPAAIDDAAAALSWLRGAAATTHPWLAESADFAQVFVAGESSGANMSHHVAVMRGSGRLPLDPLRVAGHVMVTPFFAGAERTAAEAAAPPPDAGAVFTPEMSDKLWRMSLPAGATLDHPVANPFGPDSPFLEPVAFPPVLVVSAGRDMLHERVLRYTARLREMGKPVELVVLEEQEHAFFSRQPWGEGADEMIRVVKNFVHKGNGAECN